MAYLMLAGDFPPQTGGIQSYHAHLARALQVLGRHVEVVAVAQPGDREWDAGAPFRVTRVAGGRGKVGTYRLMRDQALHVAGRLPRPLRGIIATKWSPESPAALQAARELGVPWGVFGHDREFVLTAANGLKWAMQTYCLRRADRCFAISHYAAANFGHRGVPPARVRMVGAGVDAEAFAADPEGAEALRQRWGLGQRPVLLTVSRLAPRKGHWLVLQALPEVIRRVGPVWYVIAGEGDTAARLQAEVAAMGLEDAVRMVGGVPASDLPALYTLADVMVMPSHDLPGQPTEGFGLTYLEANCAGTPVIGSRCGGVPDAIDHGITGLLTPQRDVPALTAAMVALLSDLARAAWMGEQGRRRARELFRWEWVARRVDAAYDECQSGPVH